MQNKGYNAIQGH